jgi:hypothetical protein
MSVDINVTGMISTKEEASNPPGQLAWFAFAIVILGWGAAVVYAADTGTLAGLHQPFIAAIVATTILAPTLLYFASSAFRRLLEAIGHRRIVMFHVWRIPAALLFIWYGAKGELPPLFWLLAGVGDLLAGTYALRVVSQPEDSLRYNSFHRFGFTDFLVAVGTGLTFTLLLDPRMAPIAVLPLALVPLFGVGVSGASHLMAFDMLRRGVGFKGHPSARGERR